MTLTADYLKQLKDLKKRGASDRQKCLASYKIYSKVSPLLNSMSPEQGFLSFLFRDTDKKSKLYLTVLRLFYVLGPPQYEQIGLMDFVPQIEHLANSFQAKPRWEPFTQMLQRAGNWMYNLDIKQSRIVTVDCIETKLIRRGGGGGNSADNYEVDSNKSFYNEGSFESITFIKTIRIAYAISASPFEGVALNRGPITLTSRCFIPVRIGPHQTESLSSLIYRIGMWIKATGVNVVGLETVAYEYDRESQRPVNEERVDHFIQGFRGHYFLTGVRLFIDGIFEEPSPSLLPQPPAYVQTSGSCCTIM